MYRHLLFSGLIFALSHSCWATSPLKLYRDIYFADNSHRLSERQLEMVGAIACSTIAMNAPVVVTAFASKHERNASALALKRLSYVQKLLIQHGVPEENVFVESKGDKHPIASEESTLGQAKNRHIEIDVLGWWNPKVCRNVAIDQPKTVAR